MANQNPPVKNQAYTLIFCIRKNDGTIIANPTITAARVSKDGASSAAASNSVSKYDTTYGMCSLALTATEMNADFVFVEITASDTGAIPTAVTIDTYNNTQVVLLSNGTGTGQVSLSSGAVTVGTNNDKTGYTASTVSDKTGYSLAPNQQVIVSSGTVTSVTNDVGITQTGADKVWSSATRDLTSFGTLINDIWSYATRTLTAFGFSVTASSVTDKTGYSLLVTPPTAADIWSYVTRTLTSGGGGSLTAADVWSYATRTLTQTLASVVSSMTVGSTITAIMGDTVSISVSGLGSLANLSKLYFTVKNVQHDLDADSYAVLQIEKNTGLLVLNGATAPSSWGSITVTDANAGNITITINADASVQLPEGTHKYDIQIVRSVAPTVSTLASGNFTVTSDVTKAIS